MAFRLFKRKGSPFWYIGGTFQNVTIEGRSTKTRDKRIAQRVLQGLEREIIAAGPTGKRDAFTFADAAKLYLAHHQRTQTDQNAIERLVAEIGILNAEDVTRGTLADAAIKLYPKGAPSTRNRMAIMNGAAILHYAAEEKKIGYVKIKRFDESAVPARDVDPEIAKTLIGSSEGRQRLLLLMLFRQGWRLGELLAIEWPHIRLADGMILKHNAKEDVWDTVPLHDEIVTELAAITEDERAGKLFPWPSRWEVYEWLWPLTKKLGVRFTPHMARHSFATWLVNSGASSFDLLATGNWTDLKSVKRYTRLDRERARSVINRLK